MLNKKHMKKRAFRFEGGGEVGTDEDYDEFLRDRRGEVVRDGNDQPIRARGSGKPAPIERKDTDFYTGRPMNEPPRTDAAPIENREFPKPVDRPPVAEVSPVRPAPVLSGQPPSPPPPAAPGMGSSSTAPGMGPPPAAPGVGPSTGTTSPFAAFANTGLNTNPGLPARPPQPPGPATNRTRSLQDPAQPPQPQRSAAQPQPEKAKVKPAGGRVATGKTAEQEAEAEKTRKRLAARDDLKRRQDQDKPLKPFNPEFNLLGGPALRGLAGLGKGLAGKLAGERAAKQAARKEPTLSPQMKDMGPADVVKKEAPRLTLDKGSATAPKLGEAKGPFPGDRRQLGKEGPSSAVVPKGPGRVEKDMGPVQEVRKELSKPTKQESKAKGKKKPEKRKKKDDDIGRFEGEGGKSFRRGGAVKSASFRGDGIASRGKTRGRYI